MLFQNNTAEDQPQQVDVDPGVALERLDAWVDGFIRMLPNIGVAIILFIIVYFVARTLKGIVLNRATSRGRSNLGEMLGGLIKWTVLIVGLLLCATIVMPSINPGDLIAGLGVSSVAIGFAFKDILQNWLAGLLILLRQPFEIGDQIVVNDFEGTVEHIETRATIIKTYSGEKVVIPNSEIYTNAVKVKTAYEKRRSQYDVGIGYGDDINKATEAIRKVVEGVEGVEADPGVDVLPWGLDASWVTIRVRWWTDTKRTSVVKVYASVIQAIKEILDNEGIDMPYDTKVHLIHDQTEETDGDREQQREGWPSMGEDNPKPRWKKEKEREKEPAHED